VYEVVGGGRKHIRQRLNYNAWFCLPGGGRGGGRYRYYGKKGALITNILKIALRQGFFFTCLYEGIMHCALKERTSSPPL
jgi:hypothetical protein